MSGARLAASALLLVPLILSSSVGSAATPDTAPKVVFAGFHSAGASSYAAVNVMAADGSGKRAITPRLVPAEIVDPAESGGSPDELTPRTVALSPDGQTVAFTTDTSNYDCCGRKPIDGELLVVRLDGSGLRRLTTTPSRDESRPLFSPDGRQLAFLQDASINQTDRSKVSLAVVNTDGTGLRVIASAKPGASPDNVQVSWHPDSRRLLFYPGPRYSGEPPEHSFLIDVRSGARKTVYGGPAQFSPDGKQVGVFWGSELYVGALAQFGKQDFSRRLRPRITREYSKAAALLSLPSDFLWLPGGRILYTAMVTKPCPNPDLPSGSLFAIVDRLGAKRVIGRQPCGSGGLVAPASPAKLLWVYGRRLFVSTVDRWSPRVLEKITYTSVAFGYQSVLKCGGIDSTSC